MAEINLNNRLQFVHCDECFANAEEAKAYVIGQLDTISRPALYAEPMILKYGDEKNPNIILAIGSVGDGVTPSSANKTFFIDSATLVEDIKEIEEEISTSEKDIKELSDAVKNIIKSCGFGEDGVYEAPDDAILNAAKTLTDADVILSQYIQKLEHGSVLNVEDTNTITHTLDENEGGRTLSSNVKLAKKKVVDNVQIPNNIIIEGEDGIFINVDLNYDEENNDLKFSVNGETKVIDLPSETHLESGYYDTTTESIILVLTNGDKISIDVEKLIGEWTVLGTGSTKPLILTKRKYKYEDAVHEVDKYQDILEGDVRLSSKKYNILEKVTENGLESLFVRGNADNISYWKDGKEITVKEALDTAETKVSTSNDNIISKRIDGIFANVSLDYNNATNILTFKHTNKEGTTNVKEFTLNSVQILDDARYDADTESIVLRFITADKQYKTISIPVAGIMDEWTVDNNAKTVTLVKKREYGMGHSVLSADVNVSTLKDNILIKSNNHDLYVKGTADNIKFENGDTVVDAFNKLNTDISNETTRAKTMESVINDKIKDIDSAIISENVRATNAEDRLNSKIDNEIKHREDADKTLEDKAFTAINTEIQDRKDAIGALESNTKRAIEDEATKRENADNALEEKLTDKINANTASILTETQNRKDADNALEEKLTDKINANTASILAETQSRKDADKEIKESISDAASSIANEVTRAEKAEETLRDEIIAETTRAEKAENEITNTLTNLVNSETTRAEKAENDLQTNIDKANADIAATNSALDREVARATSSETTLQTNINGVQTNLDTEVNRATSAENLLANEINTTKNSLSDEVTRAEKAEETLRDEIVAETTRAEKAETSLGNEIKNEVTRATGVEEQLESKIGANSSAIITEISNREKAEAILTEKIKANAQAVADEIARAKGVENEIKNMLDDVNTELEDEIDGINVSYDPATNSISFTNSKGETKVEKINNASLIDHMDYDQKTKTLHIWYKKTDSEELVDVEIELTDLFNQLSIDTTTSEAGAVHLTLTTDNTVGNDILSAEVKVSAAPSNLLVNDNGNLYVSNSASNIKFEDGSNVIDALNGVKTSIAAETDERKTSDDNLSKAIAAETATRLATDNQLSNSINAEVVRAANAEATIDTKVNKNTTDLAQEIADRKTNEATINDQLDKVVKDLAQEIADRKIEDVNVSSQVTTITNNFETEVSNRANADKALSDRISALETGSSESETEIKKEIADLKNADTQIKSDLLAETNRATNAETTLNTAIANETTRATNAESIIDAKVETNKSDITTLKSDVATNKTSISDEVTRAKDAENTLSSNITAETNRATNAETTLNTAIENEVTRATNAETTLNTKVETNKSDITTLKSDVATNKTSISDEVTRAKDAENTLSNSIKDVNSIATANSQSISDEVTRAKDAEQEIKDTVTALETKIEQEIKDSIKENDIVPLNTPTINLTKEGVNLSGEVNISSKNGNIISASADGIYANDCKLTYDTGSNTLTFTNALGESSPIVLNSIDTIKNIYFDGESDELVFQYTVEGADKEVRIKAASFFKGIVGSDASATHNITVSTGLTTTEGGATSTGITAHLNVGDIINITADRPKSVDVDFSVDSNKLIGKVGVSTLDSNILEVDNNDNLYVNGVADNIIAYYKDSKTNVQEAIGSISSDIVDLSNEVAYVSGSVHDMLVILNTHTDQIRVLSGDLKTEIERAQEVEKTLSGAIDANSAEIIILKERVDGHDIEIKDLKDRVTAIEERIEEGFKEIFERLDLLDKKTNIIDDNKTDYLHQTFTWMKEEDGGDGQTHVTTELKEDLSRDPESGENLDF